MYAGALIRKLLARERIENFMSRLKLKRANHLFGDYISFIKGIQLTSELAKFIGLELIRP